MVQINFSKFDKLFTLLDHDISLDGFGGYHTDWREVHKIWAQIRPIIPDRKSQGLRPVHPWTHRLFTRFHSVIKEGMRLNYEDGVFIIDHIINHEEKGHYLELLLIRRKK